MGAVLSLYLEDILHAVSQALLVPTIVFLILFIAFALFALGSILVEVYTERRNYKVCSPGFLARLEDCTFEDILDVIRESELLKRQKQALFTLVTYSYLPSDGLVALAKRLVANENGYYQKRVGRVDLIAKIAPMLGLMGTLIPLGPGIVALGQGETNTLASSLLIAFDTTVAGLVTAVVCLIIVRFRKRWYADYMVTLESSMTCILEKAQQADKDYLKELKETVWDNAIVVELPVPTKDEGPGDVADKADAEPTDVLDLTPEPEGQPAVAAVQG